jgi:hypothetical protein
LNQIKSNILNHINLKPKSKSHLIESDQIEYFISIDLNQ